MFRLFCLQFILTLVLAGCRTIPIDVSHASTDKGYLNSGLRNLGALYLLDTSDGKISELGSVELSNRTRGAIFEEQTARGVRGIVVGADIDVGAQARIENEISTHSYIKLVNAFDESYTRTFNDLSKEINRREADGEDLGFSWFLDEAVEAGSGLRYLLIYSTIRADEAVIGYRNAVSSEGSLNVPIRGRGNLNVEISGLSEEKWKGKEVPVLVRYHVIQAFLNDGSYSFRIDRRFDTDDLSSILSGEATKVADEPELVSQRR